MIAATALTVLAAAALAAFAVAALDRWRARLPVARVVNCTGPAGGYDGELDLEAALLTCDWWTD